MNVYHVRKNETTEDKQKRILALGLVEKFQAEWDCKPYTGRARQCLARLVSRNHRCSWDYGSCITNSTYSDALDHPEWWVRDDGKLILTAHSYSGETASDYPDLVAWCKENEIWMRLKTKDESWYNPLRTFLIILGPKPNFK